MEEVCVRYVCSLVLTAVLILHSLLSCNVFPATCNYSTEIRPIFFLFVFCEIAGAPKGGFHPHCLPQVPLRGFHSRTLLYFSAFSFFFIIFCFVFDDQGVGGVETRPCSTTSTDLSRVSMNSYLERGFL